MDVAFITDIPLLSARYSVEQGPQNDATDNNFSFTQQPPQQLLAGLSDHLYNADQQHELQQADDECKFLNFIWACALMVPCYLGYLGNVLSFLALNRDRRNSATMLLQALSISDIVLLISVNITDAVPYYCDYIGSCVNPWKSWPPIRYVWILTPIGHMCSIWLVVLVAANRYWAVCKPHSASQTWSNKRTFSYIAVVFSMAFIFNVPRFFEYKIVEVKEEKLLNVSMNLSYLESLITYSHENISTPYNQADNFAVVNVSISDTNLYINDQGKNHILNNEMFNPLSDNNKSSKSNPTYKSQKTYGLKEQTTSFGESTLYKVGYKVFLVNTFLVIIPIPLLFVTSLWIIRSLKKSVERSRSYLAPPNKSQSVAAKGGVPVDENIENQEVTIYENKQINNNADSVKSLSAKNKSHKKPFTGSIHVKEEKGVSKNRFGSSLKKVSASKEITFLLVTVILVAVACQTPLTLFHFVRYAYSYGCRDLVYYLESASKFLVNVNSCINFVLYCVLSPKFRGLLKSLIKCQSPENQKQSRPLLNQERSFKLAEKKSNRTSNAAKRDEDEKITKLSDKESDKEDDDETKALVAVVVAETPILTKIETIATNEPATETEMAALLENENGENTRKENLN